MSQKNTKEPEISTSNDNAFEDLPRDEASEPCEPPKSAEEAPAAEAPDIAARELMEAKDQLLRVAAEYDNFRKRTAREREALYGTVTADTISKFLPILDNLERAEAAPTTDPVYAQGISMITKQFVDILAKAGVEEIEAIGKPFDSELHNAVMHVEQEEAGESEVVEVFQKGYKTASRVIRHSVVKVAN